ncbi:MAG: glucosamine-6-phosphate deaminase [Clostridia bacterium]|nr:glucosamine-6-phosphate deaminase [Clostridia bacterium]
MNFLTVESYQELSEKAARMIAEQVILNPQSILGLATGSSPVGTYNCLADMHKNGELDFSRVTSVNLDEYVGLSGENPQSYRYFMNENLFSKVNIGMENTYVPNGCAEDLLKEGTAYDDLIAKLGGIDLQLLGIGLDGHIGFNEPDDVFTKETHVVNLDPSTIEANARFFASVDEVPKKAITMGMGSIMQAKKILLIASGENKKEILHKAFYGPITPKVPASVLQLHPDVTVIYSVNN